MTIDAPIDKFVSLAGLQLRYLEQGHGDAVLFMHGASLGSSADVFLDVLGRFAGLGFRAIALDIPGYGLSDALERQTRSAQRGFITKFIDALGLGKVALVAHSRAGGDAVQLALEEPDRYSRIIILGTGYLLPPANEGQIGRHAAAQARADRDLAEKEPTRDDIRRFLEADVFDHSLITEKALDLRHSRSIGKNFIAHVARQQDEEIETTDVFGIPLWQRIRDIKPPLMMIYGREDRGNACVRATTLRTRFPDMKIYIIDKCKHMVPWDAAAEIVELIVPFLK
jgi:4,5:9,10-diseco-3-hydroxy-5,9,17-trioxoandrosta-1(10),2-diene-4-oate hydrolase